MTRKLSWITNWFLLTLYVTLRLLVLDCTSLHQHQPSCQPCEPKYFTSREGCEKAPPPKTNKQTNKNIHIYILSRCLSFQSKGNVKIQNKDNRFGSGGMWTDEPFPVLLRLEKGQRCLEGQAIRKGPCKWETMSQGSLFLGLISWGQTKSFKERSR